MSTRAQRKAESLAKQAKLTPQKSKGSAKGAAGRPKTQPERIPNGDRVIDAQFEAGATHAEQFLPPAFSEIAFAGRSNVGKSSLLNCLTGRRNLVRTSSTPGCTRQVSWFRTTSDDKSIIDLVDLPGYGYAKRSKSERGHWALLIEGYLLERPTLRGVVVLLDIRRGVERDDIDLIEMLQSPARVSRRPLEVMVVATKMDKLSPTSQKSALLKLSQELKMQVLGFSSETALGRLPLWRQIRKAAGVGLHVEPETTVEPESAPEAEVSQFSEEERPAAHGP